jgi:hypothetical protein
MSKAKNVTASAKTAKIVLSLSDFTLLNKILSVPMHGEAVRMRNKFFNLIEPAHQDLYDKVAKEKEALYKNVPEKPADDKNADEFAKLKAEADEKFARIILESNTEIEITKEVKAMFRNAYMMLLKSTKDLGPAEGKTYDELMSKIEDLDIVKVK